MDICYSVTPLILVTVRF